MSIYDKASLVLIPSGTKTSKVYSQVPVNGDGDFTFSRSTAATRVNASGNIEKETSNLFLQSNSFDTTWLNVNTSETGGQTGYDGSSDAWLISITSGNARIYQNITTSGVKTFSVYAKAGSLSWMRLRLGSAPKNSRYFDLTNGVIGSGGIAPIDATITSVGGGWYRCSITTNISIDTAFIYPAQGDNDLTATSGNIYIQDAQLEQGLVARDVLTTTTAAVEGGITDNVPRLDYTDSSCPALLLEPQRSNLLVQSEYYSTTPYSRVNASVTHNDTTSPEGVVNAVKLESSSNGSASRVETFPTFADNTIYTASIFAKQGNVDYIMVNVRDKNNVQHNTYFDLSDGTKGSSNGSPISTSIEAVGDYYRVSITIDSSSGGTTPRLQYLIANTDNNVVTASGEYIYIYGAQLEAGSYATSYIPTYGTSVTFAVDDCDAVSATSLIGQSEGTLFLDFVANDDDALQIIYQVRTTGSTNVGQIDFRIQSGNLRALGNDGGTTQFNISAGAAVAGTRYKCAVRYANNNVAFYVNGVLKGSDTNASFSSSSLDQITFNENGTTFYPSVNVNQALVIPTALPNTELAALTTI